MRFAQHFEELYLDAAFLHAHENKDSLLSFLKEALLRKTFFNQNFVRGEKRFSIYFAVFTSVYVTSQESLVFPVFTIIISLDRSVVHLTIKKSVAKIVRSPLHESKVARFYQHLQMNKRE